MDGDGLKVIRKGWGLTQAEMAKELGVTRQSYIAWEKNVYQIPAAKVKQIVDGSPTRAPLVPKETVKEKRIREAGEKHLAEHWRGRYKALRAWPDIPNHNAAMRFFAKQGNVIPQCAYAGIVEDFPDILTDPDGDYTMTKEQSFATLGITTKS